jgi:hypothetical protein
MSLVLLPTGVRERVLMKPGLLPGGVLPPARLRLAYRVPVPPFHLLGDAWLVRREVRFR